MVSSFAVLGFSHFSGASGGVTAPTKNFVPVTMVEIQLDQGASVRQDLPADYNAVIVVLEGKGSIGAEAKFVTAGDVVWLTHGESGKESEVAIRARDKPLRALLYASRPLHEAAVARGHFGMNTEAEIEQAYADYRAGRFGPIWGVREFGSGRSWPTAQPAHRLDQIRWTPRSDCLRASR